MRPVTVFTVQEIQKLVPSFTEEILDSTSPDVKQKIYAMFWKLGADVSLGIEKQRDLTTKNRFGDIDKSTRIVVAERLDREWLESKYSSNEAKFYTQDVSLQHEMYNISKRSNVGVVDYSDKI